MVVFLVPALRKKLLKYKHMRRQILIFSLLILGLVLAAWFHFGNQPSENPPPDANPPPPEITDFMSCADAGNPVMESWPRQCRTADGRTFTEDIGNETDKLDLIQCDSPRPNALVTSPLQIAGQARGYWFFESDFPVMLFDGLGNELARGPASTQEEWMTEDYIRFMAELTFEEPETETGELHLLRDNPSGLPENDDLLIVPVRFK